MTEKITNIIKYVCTGLLIIGLIGIVLANGIRTKTTDIQEVVRELVELKDAKQECLDSLTYQEAIEEYKWISHCGLTDERIMELKSQLTEFLRNDYERVDEKIEEIKQERILANQNTTAVEKLTFLLAE